jgi:hypothetical protein
MLTVTVKNRAGEYVMGLDRNAFQLIDEKEVRPIEFLESSDNSTGLLLALNGLVNIASDGPESHGTR